MYRFKADFTSHSFCNCLANRKSKSGTLGKLIKFLKTLEYFSFFIISYTNTGIFFIKIGIRRKEKQSST